MRDLNARIQQLTRLILTSQTVEEGAGKVLNGGGVEGVGGESRSGSPVKVDFDMSPYQVGLFVVSLSLYLRGGLWKS